MWYRSIIDGTKAGWAGRFVRAGLWVLSLFYRAVVAFRNAFYDWGWLRARSLSAPVVCVGNLTAGGTGKSPMAMWICRYLQSRGKKVVLLSRGYKAQSDEGNDEVQLMRKAMATVPVVIDKNRVRGGEKAIAEYQPDIIVLDDGFQHRSLSRDLDVVMIDCMCPFGYGHFLPRGLLREPLRQLNRADVFVLSRSDSIPSKEKERITSQIVRVLDRGGKNASNQLLCSCRHKPVGLYNNRDERKELTELDGKTVAAFCGIGNPEAFIETLKQEGAIVKGKRFLMDHINYDGKFCSQLRDFLHQTGAEWLVTTEKDWVKLREMPAAWDVEKIYWLQIELEINEGQEQLCRRLDQFGA